MICNNCGLTLKDTARFCAGCGTAIASDAAEISTLTSPVSALIADSPVQSISMVSCVIHPSTTAIGSCSDCRNFFCRDCMVNIASGNYCRACAARLRAPLPQSTSSYGYAPTSPATWTPPPQPYQYVQPAPTYQYPAQVVPYVQPPLMYVKRKEPGIALLLSFLLPGLGQFYNGDVGKGIALMLGFFVLVWIGIGIVFWIWAMIDAYQSATNINMGRRI